MLAPKLKKHFSLIFLILFLSIIFTSCGYRASIEQEVKQDSFIDCTYSVKTYLWINTLWIFPESIEKMFYQSDVKRDAVELVKQSQYERMIFYKALADKAINERGPCR